MREILWVTKKTEDNKKRNNIYYYLTIFSVVFGNSVGITLFTQSQAAIKSCKNPIALLIIYGFIGLVCLSLILVCIELMSAVGNKFNTIPHWIRNFVGRRFGSISAIFYSFIYMPAIICVLSLMSWGTFFNIIDMINGSDNWVAPIVKTVLIYVLSAISIVSLILFNGYSNKYKDKVIIFLNLLKLLPVIIIVVVSFYVLIVDKLGNGVYNTVKTNNNNIFVMMFGLDGVGNDQWSLKYFVLGVPLVMLAFDGFLHGVSVGNDSENQKIVSHSSFIAVIVVILLNVSIVALLLAVTPDVQCFGLLEKQIGPWCSELVGMLFCITILGSIIGFGSFGTSNLYTATDPNVEGGQLICTKSGWQLSYESAAWKQMIVYVIYLTVSIFTSYLLFNKFITFDSIVNSNSFFLGNAICTVALSLASVVAVFSFLFYTSLVLILVVNRFTKKVEVKKMLGIETVGILITPILWCFCLYILFINFYNVSLLWTDNNIMSNMDNLTSAVTAVTSLIMIVVTLSIFGFNEFRLRKIMMQKIFSNKDYQM